MYKILKRLIDLTVAIIGLILSLPILLPVVILLKFSGDGHIFYFQERIGYKNKRFFIWKFATMIESRLNIEVGRATVKNDPRVTYVGKILRKTKINELPQLVNILKGDMTLVGPRPLLMGGFMYYSDEVKNKIYNVKPGLTGIGSVIFRDEETLASRCLDLKELYKKINSQKGQLELWYQKNMSLQTDFLIIFLTAYSIFFPKQNLTYKIFRNLPQLKELDGSSHPQSPTVTVARSLKQNHLEVENEFHYK